MTDLLKKTYRITENVNAKIKELMKIYEVKSENELIEKVVNDIYKLKQSKALIPYEEFEKRDLQLQKALLEVGRLQGVLEEKKKGFWARLFG